jgi:hypothetical protein
MRAYFRLPYRRIEGAVIAHASTKLPWIQHFDTINGCINRLEIKINQRKISQEMILSLPSTVRGIQAANRGEWIRHKWHVRTLPENTCSN